MSAAVQVSVDADFGAVFFEKLRKFGGVLRLKDRRVMENGNQGAVPVRNPFRKYSYPRKPG